MHSPNHRPGKLDTLSQHAVEINHRLQKPDMLSQHTQHRMLSQHALQIMCCIKEAAEAQNSGQADTAN